jgi:hypothetical protein
MKQAIVFVAVVLAVTGWCLTSSAETDYRYTERTSIWLPATDLLPADYPSELRRAKVVPEVEQPAPVKEPVLRETGGFNFLDRLEVGTRVNYFLLLDDSRDITKSFLGSITKLKALQNYYPNELFVSFDITDWLALEAGYEEITAKAVTENDKHSDGIFMYDGPGVSVVGRMANDTVFTPFVSIGAAMMNAKMKLNPVWHHGFGGTPEEKEKAYQAWLKAGSPPWPNGGRERTLDPEDQTAVLLALGCDMDLTSSVSMRVFANYMSLSARTHYYLSTKGKITEDRHYATFPLDNVSAGVGVKYCF